MKLAYLLMVHKNAADVARLLETVQDGQNYVAIHVDKKSGKAFRGEIEKLAANHPNTRLIPSRSCVWCGWSLAQVALDGMQFFLDWADDWDFYFNLSGQDCALQTQEEMRDYLRANRGANFLGSIPLARWKRGMKLIKYYNLEIPLKAIYRPVPTFIPRRFLTDVVPHHGSAWHTLNREFCKYVTSSPEVDRFKKFYRFALIPEEMFFQTVLLNSSFSPTWNPGNLRYIPKFPGKSHPRILTMHDLDDMLASGKMFATSSIRQLTARSSSGCINAPRELPKSLDTCACARPTRTWDTTGQFMLKAGGNSMAGCASAASHADCCKCCRSCLARRSTSGSASSDCLVHKSKSSA